MHLEDWDLAAFIVCLVVGIYLLLFHVPPFPFNHEAVGLGTFHALHAVAGLAFLAAAWYIWDKGLPV